MIAWCSTPLEGAKLRSDNPGHGKMMEHANKEKRWNESWGNLGQTQGTSVPSRGWDMMRYDEIWWDMMRYDEIWWDMMRYDEIWWDMYADVTDISDISDISDINGRVISGGCLWPRRDAGLRRQDDHHLHQWQRSVEGFHLISWSKQSKRYDMTQQTLFDTLILYKIISTSTSIYCIDHFYLIYIYIHICLCVFFGWNGWLENSGRPKNRDGGPRTEPLELHGVHRWTTHFNTMTHHMKKMEKKTNLRCRKKKREIQIVGSRDRRPETAQ